MKFLRLMALLEGLSLLVLFFVAMPLKYMYGMPEAVTFAGPIHGWLFVAFNALLFYFVYKRHLTEEQGFSGFIASFLPFGTFVYKAKVLKKL